MVVLMCGFYFEWPFYNIAAALIFGLASATDGIDGHIARKHNLVTDFGKFLDPLADKLLVASALICFVELGRVSAWMVIVILARELCVDGLRMVASQKGVVIAAGWPGKIKTNLQIFCILCAMIIGKHIVTDIFMYAMALMTLISGVEYFKNSWKLLKDN